MRAAWGLIGVALVLTSGCAQTDWIDRTLVTADVSGVWMGSMATLDGQPMMNIYVRLDLRQQAAKVTGFLEWGVGSSRRGSRSRITGSVAGDVFTFEGARTLTGELTLDGDEMKGFGVLEQGRRLTIMLRRADTPSSPAASPPR